MRRVVVDVTAFPDSIGWSVHVRTMEGGQPSELVEPYVMAAATVGGRRVPTTPADRIPVAGEDAAVGGGHRTLCVGDSDAITGLMDRLRLRTTGPDDVGVYGRWLFECLLAPAWPAITSLPDVVAERAVELALRWPVTENDLHRMVWEAMRDERGVLAGHPDRLVAITRLVPGQSPTVQTITGVPRVLFASGVRLADPTIRPGAMYMGLLRALDNRGRCLAHAVQGASVDDLRDHCRRFQPDVVHVVAHGVLLDDGRGALMLPEPSGLEREADATALLAALSAGGRPLAVVLSACNTASPGDPGTDPTEASPLAAQLVAAGIPVVSAMAGEISEPACRLYTRRLADAVHGGASVVEASAHGRRAALVGSERREIDWALATLFLADGIDARQPLVDGSRADALSRLADDLTLRREPVFIGRQEILTAADLLVQADSELAVISVLSSASTAKLGGHRLLQEIGWRLLRDGHVPLLLGPYPDKHGPTLARRLVEEILRQLVAVTDKMDLEPFVPAVLWADDPGGTELAALASALPGMPPSVARTEIRSKISAYAGRPSPVDPATLRDLLADDFAELADRAAAWGPPFGAHSRVVVLCIDVHGWASPAPGDGLSGTATHDALDCLLAMLSSSGLGRTQRPVPVVLTGSKTTDGGPLLAKWSVQGQPGFREFTLGELAADDAMLGYQWVLLHPWTTKPPDDDRFGRVYTPDPLHRAERLRMGQADSWEETLRWMGSQPGSPTSVQDRLYDIVQASYLHNVCRRDDDEQAWRAYIQANPGYQL
jgi:CHAT domain